MRVTLLASASLLLVAAACTGSTASPGPEPTPSPSVPQMGSPSPGVTARSPEATSASPAPTADPLAPRVIPELAEVIDIEGTVVLGFDEDYATVLYDLADGSTVALDFGKEGWPMDLSARVVVGSGGGSLKPGQPFVYDRATATMVPLALGGENQGKAQAADDRFVAGTGSPSGVFVFDLDTGKLRMLDILPGRYRVRIAAISGQRMAGTSGLDGDEQAWVYDRRTGVLTDLHARLGGSNSWVTDIDGDLVVGSVETPNTWVQRAFVYDAAADTIVDLAPMLGGSSWATAVDGSLVVGTVATDGTRAFVYDVRTGAVRLLPGLPGSGEGREEAATMISGRIVLGTAGGSIVAWDLSAMP